jgi:hypothetical protein
MFATANNLKQAIAIAAILLSLSTLAQTSGLYCHLGACGAEPPGSVGEKHTCCQHQKCESKEPSLPLGERRHNSCPCPDSCWCHQAPQPFQPTQSFDESFEGSLLDVFVICNDIVAGGVVDQETLVTWSLAPDLEDESAVCRCAQLCRFLI